MDDDPEPNMDSVIFERCAKNEQVINVEECQKFSLDSSEESNNTEMNQHQESGDTGPFLEQEVPKKSISGKVVPDQVPQMDSKDSIFRRKERVDQGPLPDASGSVKSSATSLRKPPRRSLPRLPGQDSRRTSQQSAAQQLPLTPKTSRSQPSNSADAKDAMWVSHRTGKAMKCESQQTSRIWEQRMLSDILCSSCEESERSKEEESEVTNNTEEEFTSLWETTTEDEAFREEARRQGSQPQPEGEVSKHIRKSHRSSQQSIQQSSLLSPKTSHVQTTKAMDTEEAPSWMSQRMKCKSQQTSIVWEENSLAETLCSSQDSQISRDVETESTDAEESLVSSLGEAEEIQQAEKQKPELQSQGHINKTDQSQQTDSADSLKRRLLDSSQQTDVSDDTNISSVEDSGLDTRPTEAQKSQQGSQELMKEEEGGKDPQVSMRSSQQSLKPRAGGEDEPEGEQTEWEQRPPLAKEAPGRRSTTAAAVEDLWISQKTGKVVRNQSQQTDKSWLQYHAAKMLKIKKCSSQQTEESFLQRYASKKAKEEGRAAQPSSAEANPNRPSSASHDGSDEVDTGDLKFVDVDVSSLEGELARTDPAPDLESLTSEGQGGAELQQPAAESQKEAQPSSSPVQWSEEPDSQTALEDTSSYVEGQDAFVQTYSIISLEDGIWMNRRTGKLLVSHSQQTSAVPSLACSKTSLGKLEEAAEKAFNLPGASRTDGGRVDVKQSKRKDTLQKSGTETVSPKSDQGSRLGQDRDPHLIIVQPVGRESQLSEDIEELVSSRLSEAMLLSLDSPDLEDEPEQVYAVISLEEGSWLNVKTGKQLSSQRQQTEESFESQHLAAMGLSASTGVTSQRPSAEGQAQICTLLPAYSDRKQCAEGGMDDDPGSKILGRARET